VPPDHVIKMAQPLKFSVRRSQAEMLGALGLLFGSMPLSCQPVHELDYRVARQDGAPLRKMPYYI